MQNLLNNILFSWQSMKEEASRDAKFYFLKVVIAKNKD